jgi:hypothetical protein
MREKLFSVTIKDCEVQTFRVGGNGGQKVNKTSSGVRVIHHPSGARGESREERSQLQNKRAAFIRMTETPHFQYWCAATASGVMTPLEIEAAVEASMAQENIVTEVKVNGEWVTVDPDSLG